MYAKQQAEAGAAGSAGAAGGCGSEGCGTGDCADGKKKADDNVVDAEYTEVKDKK